MNEIKTEKVGARVYVSGNTYAIKDALKSAGCHWDGERRQWWIGAAKAEALKPILDGGAEADKPVPANTTDARVHARVEYKGRSYYVLAYTQDGQKAKLTSLDGQVQFWAATAECKTLKTYQSREVRRGYGRTQTEYTTLGSIRSFVERERRNREQGGGVCAECGKSGDLVRDLEDGQMKHSHCCDIPPG
jgi:hypothetical protein